MVAMVFKKDKLNQWNELRKGTANLNIIEYEKCFHFAIKMAYGSGASHGVGIRGVRSEVQMADDFIFRHSGRTWNSKVFKRGIRIFKLN